MQRYFINETIKQTHTIYDEQIVHHLLHVLRSKVNDQFILCDHEKQCYKVKITHIEQNQVTVEQVTKLNADDNALSITLAASLIRKERYEFMLQKATELGVHTVIPVMSERTIIKLDDKGAKKKVERWRTITKEAAEQSHRYDLVDVREITPLKTIDFNHYDQIFLAYEAEDDVSFKTHLKQVKPNDKILILIGPEGGYSEQEVSFLKTKGAISVSLGKRILRAETASLYALSAISYEIETSD